MNSSTKFIYNLLLKLKFPLLGYIIVLVLLSISALISLNLTNYATPFSSLLILSASSLPFFIMTFAIVQFFEFRSEKSYSIFLTTIPLTHTKQIQLSLITLGSLVFGFSAFVFLCIGFFNKFVTLSIYNIQFSFPVAQLFNMSFAYFLTLFLFSSFLIFLKLLLTHNRSFYIALFFFVLSVLFISTTPPQFLLRSLKVESLFPVPFNLLSSSPKTFPHLSMSRIVFFLSWSALFITSALYFYRQERITHQAIQTQRLATIIAYSLFLTPTLYIVYNYSQTIFSIIILISLIIIASIILKINFKKIHLTTLLVPFLFANSVSIPLVIATPNIIEHQQLDEWRRSQFVSTTAIELSFSDMPLFGQNRSIIINSRPTVHLKNLLQLLNKSSNASYNAGAQSPNKVFTSENDSLNITWKSEASKLDFARFLENYLVELDQSKMINLTGTISTFEGTNCTVFDTKIVCSSEQPFKSTFATIQTTLEQINQFEAESNDNIFYILNIESEIWPSVFITISDSRA